MKIFKCLIAFSVIVISSLTFASGTLSAQLINTVVALTGNIFDAITREPLTTRIVITDDKGNRIN
ncbi:MAG: hypothetical protein NTW06_03510, partial [Candidatus Falkowbacteria bacterium]|nr:hypothetical protein [Candidatus Falkowbacteria bacterium]